MDAETPETLLSRMSEFVALKMGWDYPPSRHADLRRGIASAAKDLGFESAAECAHRCLCGSLSGQQLDRLASHLTVGETYFLRESRAFEILAREILPRLVRSGEQTNRELRIWSAGCCTGEEPYSIAILLREMLPDWREWKITLLATDINQRFLRKAEEGIFGEWSFRGAPGWLKSRYFRAVPEGRFEILPEIVEMVRFAHLNLAGEDYGSVVGEYGPMNVISCRNVLMYFEAIQARKVVEKLYRAQAEAGWLIVGASELSHDLFSPYCPVNLNGAFLYQKGAHAQLASVRETAPAAIESLDEKTFAIELPLAMPALCDPTTEEFGELPETIEVTLAEALESSALGIEARSFADRGNLTEALGCCDRWIAADKLNPASHYLRSVVLQEQGAILDAVQSLRRALYLDPEHVLAHFALGNLARGRNQPVESRRHLLNSLRLLKKYSPQAVLPESDGVTAGRLAEIIGSFTEMEVGA